jgi:hypothetical protein
VVVGVLLQGRQQLAALRQHESQQQSHYCNSSSSSEDLQRGVVSEWLSGFRHQSRLDALTKEGGMRPAAQRGAPVDVQCNLLCAC